MFIGSRTSAEEHVAESVSLAGNTSHGIPCSKKFVSSSTLLQMELALGVADVYDRN